MKSKPDSVKQAFSQRLHEAMDIKGYPKRGRARVLSQKFEISDKGAGKWLNGDAIPETSKIPLLADFLSVSTEWLLTGIEKEKFDNNVVPVRSKLLPVLSWTQASSMTSIDSIDTLEINEWLPPLSIEDSNKCFYLRVVGVSNFPTYMEGDYILIDPKLCKSELVSGDLIVVRHNTDIAFKKLVIESNGLKYLQALNPHFQPNIVEFKDNGELIGLVIDAFRPLGGSRSKYYEKN